MNQRVSREEITGLKKGLCSSLMSTDEPYTAPVLFTISAIHSLVSPCLVLGASWGLLTVGTGSWNRKLAQKEGAIENISDEIYFQTVFSTAPFPRKYELNRYP
jgi:hypothetical protein